MISGHSIRSTKERSLRKAFGSSFHEVQACVGSTHKTCELLQMLSCPRKLLWTFEALL